MSGYKGHITGAVLANTVLVGGMAVSPWEFTNRASILMNNWQFIAAMYVIAILFGLWPDVDTNSKGQNIFFAIAFTLDIVLIATGKTETAAYLGLLAMTPIIGRHRGWTHSKLAALLVPLPIVLVPYMNRSTLLAASCVLYAAAVTGYLSHLLLDGLLVKGIRFSGKWNDR